MELQRLDRQKTGFGRGGSAHQNELLAARALCDTGCVSRNRAAKLTRLERELKKAPSGQFIHTCTYFVSEIFWPFGMRLGAIRPPCAGQAKLRCWCIVLCNRAASCTWGCAGGTRIHLYVSGVQAPQTWAGGSPPRRIRDLLYAHSQPLSSKSEERLAQLGWLAARCAS
jgi:hypothetical protein